MKKYWIYFTLYWQTVFTYRFDTAVYALTGMITPLISLFVWMTISGENPELNFNRSEIIFYFLAAAFCGSVTTAWSAYFIMDDIKKGAILGYLIRPFSILENAATNNIAEKGLKLIFVSLALLLVWILFSLTYTLTLPIKFELLPLAFIALIEAVVMMILWDVAMGLCAFWADEVDFLITSFFTADILLSGRIVPIAFLPSYLQTISPYLPFRYLVSFPIELVMGKLSFPQIVVGFTVLTFWMIFFRLVQIWLYKEGSKRFQSYGG